MAFDPRAPVIVGVGQSPGPIAPHLSVLDHHRQALFAAIDDAGIEKAAIDGYFCGGGGASIGLIADDAAAMAEYLKIQHRYIDGTSVGGASYVFHLQHASAAIRAGMCDVAAITYGSDRFSASGRALGTGAFSGAGGRVAASELLEAPYGPTVVSLYALIAQRYMHEYSVTPEMLAAVAVAARTHAAMNPAAMYRDPITVDDVVGSPMIADPLHRLDCCVVSDGGGAVILTTAERARDLDCLPVRVLGAAGAQTHWSLSQMPNLTRSAAVQAGAEALRAADRTVADIDVVQLYDSFTVTVLRLFEDLGFCGPGEAGAVAAAGDLRLGGRYPCNTDGGGLSATHPGRRGIFLIIEAVRQLRGLAGDAQVANCETALIAGSGGIMSCIAAAVLARDDS